MKKLRMIMKISEEYLNIQKRLLKLEYDRVYYSLQAFLYEIQRYDLIEEAGKIYQQTYETMDKTR